LSIHYRKKKEQYERERGSTKNETQWSEDEKKKKEQNGRSDDLDISLSLCFSGINERKQTNRLNSLSFKKEEKPNRSFFVLFCFSSQNARWIIKRKRRRKKNGKRSLF
jgi:hypothetical protein